MKNFCYKEQILVDFLVLYIRSRLYANLLKFDENCFRVYSISPYFDHSVHSNRSTSANSKQEHFRLDGTILAPACYLPF